MENKNTEESGFGKRRLMGRLLMALGALFVLGSLALQVHNIREDRAAAEAANAMLPDVLAAISENVKNSTDKNREKVGHINPYDQAAMDASTEMTVVVHNTWPYIGYLTMPSIHMQLPVLAEWSYHNLGMAPCRHMGSTKSDDLVICAHNYPSHFGHIGEMKQGDEVSFVDMDGERSDYRVVTVNVISETDMDMVQDESLDLVLYTCTFSSWDRIMVGCERVNKPE